MDGAHGSGEGGDAATPRANDQPKENPHSGDGDLTDSPPPDLVDLAKPREVVLNQLKQGTRDSAKQVEARARRLSLATNRLSRPGEAHPETFALHGERGRTLLDAALVYEALGERNDAVRVAGDSLWAWQAAEAVAPDARRLQEAQDEQRGIVEGVLRQPTLERELKRDPESDTAEQVERARQRDAGRRTQDGSEAREPFNVELANLQRATGTDHDKAMESYYGAWSELAGQSPGAGLDGYRHTRDGARLNLALSGHLMTREDEGSRNDALNAAQDAVSGFKQIGLRAAEADAHERVSQVAGLLRQQDMAERHWAEAEAMRGTAGRD